MTDKLAIIAGMGALPRHLADNLHGTGATPLLCGIEGFTAEGLELDMTFRVERLALFLRALAEADVTRVIFVGVIQRPRLDPAHFDPETAALVPKLLPSLQGGDDALLRGVVGLFEDAGFAVVGVSDVAPELVPGAGVLTSHVPSKADEGDTARAAQIVASLGALDVGQGAVVAQGQCLATEALPGTDAMLGFVAQYAARLRPNPQGTKGVLYKAPKPGQECRIDLPALGPATVRAAAEAGLGGIVWEAGGALLLDRAEMIARAEELGLFLWARAS